MKDIEENNEEKIELLSCALEGGCSAKIPPDLLEKTLSPILKTKVDSNLLSDVDIGDDAGVYKISEDNAIIFTVDFFPPVVAEPYLFGEIAACNSISDIYAMGGEPKLALNITMYPKENSLNTLATILKGGQDKATEAGVLVVGGHTITDTAIKYGMAVIGFANPNNITTNSAAKEGDIIILTDVTGFGLSGHAFKMAKASDVTIEINTSALPMFEKSYEVLDMGCIPGAAFTNMRYVGDNILVDENVDYSLKMLTFDPQTAGGLFICVDKANAENMLADLWREGIDCELYSTFMNNCIF